MTRLLTLAEAVAVNMAQTKRVVAMSVEILFMTAKVLSSLRGFFRWRVSGGAPS
jgi:hypothetical protein